MLKYIHAKKSLLQWQETTNIRTILLKELDWLVPKTIRIYNQSFDNIVAEVNGKYIFRFPRAYPDTFNIERRIMKVLEYRLSLKIPVIEFVGKTYSFIGYRKIEGQVLHAKILTKLNLHQKRCIAHSLANFLNELHSCIPTKRAVRLGAKTHDLIRFKEMTPHKILESIQALGFSHSKSLERFLIIQVNRFMNLDISTNRQVLLHGDFQCENIIISPSTGRVSGIIDFGNVSIGDANIDLAYLYRCDEGLWRDTISEYEKLTHTKISRDSIRLLAYINEIMDLISTRSKDERLYDNAVNRLELWAKSWSGKEVQNEYPVK